MKQSVNFKSKTNLLAAHLYTPEQFDESKTYPAITVCHPGGVLKNKLRVCTQRNLLNLVM